MKDQEHIIARARRGDADAFEQLVAAYRNQVFRLALRMCGNEADADEVAQEAFLSAWKGLPNFRGESRFSTWLYQLTTHAAIDLMQLPEEYRQVLVLRFMQELSYEEIGQTLKLPAGTVKSRLNRAKAQLKDILSRSGNLFGAASVIHTEQQGKEVQP